VCLLGLRPDAVDFVPKASSYEGPANADSNTRQALNVNSPVLVPLTTEIPWECELTQQSSCLRLRFRIQCWK
jgi:hypothetical protein